MRLVAKPLLPRWMGIAIYFYAFVAIGLAEAGLGVVLPSILVAYGLTPATVTLLFVSQISGYITAALTSSVVTERLGLGRMLLLAASLLTGSLLIYALSPVWGLMVAAGTFLGLGIGLIDAGINTALAQDDQAAHLLGALHGCYGIGAFSGPALATTLLALGWNWRQVYGVLAGLTGFLLVGVLVALAYRYPPLMKSPVSSASPAKKQLRRALQTPTVLLFGAFLFVYVGIESSFSHWAYSVQVIARSTPPLLAGYGVSAYWLGLTVGRFLMGYGLRYLGAIRTLTLSLGLLMVGALGWWLWPSGLLSLPLIGLALAAIFPTMIWLIPKRLPEAMVPAAVGFATSAASVGAALISAGVGWVSEVAGLEVVPLLMLPLVITLAGLHGWLMRSA